MATSKQASSLIMRLNIETAASDFYMHTHNVRGLVVGGFKTSLVSLSLVLWIAQISLMACSGNKC